MSSHFDRRAFLRGAALTGGVWGLQGLVARGVLATEEKGRREAGAGSYGPLRPTKTKNTGEEILALPAGFQYTVFSKTGAAMSDGKPTPRMHDGMAAFAMDGKIRLIRNHEVNNRLGKEGIAIGDAAKSYDPLAGGGTTTVVVDPQTREVVQDFVSLSGTLQNCAGGSTPWGSWISCEETVLGATPGTDRNGAATGRFRQGHGYCFEVPVSATGTVQPVPLKAMGRFVHEAIAVDPATGIVYETEDFNPGGLYRFLPNRPARLAAGGRLQMLAIKNKPGYDTRTGQQMGRMLHAVWVDIDDPDPSAAETDNLAVYKQGLAKGGATFDRLEGCWYGDGSIFFDATSGGDKKLGQIWRYTPRGQAGGLLTLLFESQSPDVLQMPDNLCVSPRGGGLAVCEDGPAPNFVRGLTSEGRIFDFAQNLASTSELAGVNFSPDGQTLFVNIQTPGMTLAIWGPWERGAL